MKLGKITGITSTKDFQFVLDYNEFAVNNAKKFDFVKVYHKLYEFVYAQIIELHTDHAQTIARCVILGYHKDGKLNRILTPVDNNIEVFQTTKDEIKKVFSITQKGAFIGQLQPTNIDIFLDLNTVLTKHVAVLAKSGSGKSYTVGVLTEEIAKHNMPILVIDPHGEYHSLRYENDSGKEELEKLGLKPKSFYNDVLEFGDIETNKNLEQLKINSRMSVNEIFTLLPKLSASQQAFIYSLYGFSGMENNSGGDGNYENPDDHDADIDRKPSMSPAAHQQNENMLEIDDLMASLTISDNNIKWQMIHMLNEIRSANIFYKDVDLSYLIKPGKITILNLKGYAYEMQEKIIALILSKLFYLRKNNRIDPFFCIVEEAHNFCPERNFAEARSSKIIRTIASEGRKFGISLCVVSQRPSRVDKNVLSQCSTQLIMKITNPNDLKAIINSVEGINEETYEEIKSLPIGYALVANIVDNPIIVKIRPRQTKHAGIAKINLDNDEKSLNDFAKKNNELIKHILPRTNLNDLKLIYNKEFNTVLIPALNIAFNKAGKASNVIVSMLDMIVVDDIDKYNIASIESNARTDFIKLIDLSGFSYTDLILLNVMLNMKVFSLPEFIVSANSAFMHKNIAVEKDTFSERVLEFTKQGILEYDGVNFKITRSLSFVKEPERYAHNYDILNTVIDFDAKLNEKFEAEKILSVMRKFLDIVSSEKIHIVSHKIK